MRTVAFAVALGAMIAACSRSAPPPASGPVGTGGALGVDARLDTYTATCGNGILDPLEACDDGNLVNGDGCSHICTVECYYWTCDGGLRPRLLPDGALFLPDGGLPDGLDAQPSFCGDGILDPGFEECDEGERNGKPESVCSDTCRMII